MNPRPPAPPSPWEQLFLANLPLIEKLAATIARRHRASVDEAEEFTSELKLKLIEDDYAVLRKFKGEASLKTYLTTVTTRAFLDFRNRCWGKRRPSAAAKRLGPVAIRLEKLLEEGRSFDEACEILRTNYRVTESRRELEEIWKRLPTKTPREKKQQDSTDPGPRPEEQVFEDQLRETRERVAATLKRVLDKLPPEDWLIVRLSILDNRKIVDIARMLGMKQKPLYRRRVQILEQLRRDLEREGVRWEQVADLLNRSDLSWGFSGRGPMKPEEN
jgi:RNA polymerase sigma factor for flagellar operon FliA